MKAAIAALTFIFSSAAKYNVDSESLSSELQQLGLPKGDRFYFIYSIFIILGCICTLCIYMNVIDISNISKCVLN